MDPMTTRTRGRAQRVRMTLSLAQAASGVNGPPGRARTASQVVMGTALTRPMLPTRVRSTHARVGPVQLGDRGHLGHGHVVDGTERADDDAGEHEAPEVDRALGQLDDGRLLAGVAGERGQLGDRQGEDGGESEAGEGPQQGDRGRGAEAVGQVEGQEGDGRRPDDRDQQRVVAHEDGGEDEGQKHEEAGREAGEGGQPPQPAQGPRPRRRRRRRATRGRACAGGRQRRRSWCPRAPRRRRRRPCRPRRSGRGPPRRAGRRASSSPGRGPPAA